MKTIKEQNSTYNPPKSSALEMKIDPNIPSIQKFCNFENGLSKFKITPHPDTKKEVLFKKKEDGGVNYIYIENGIVFLEKRDSQNNQLSKQKWGDCQQTLGITTEQTEYINNLISKDKSYIKDFPGGGKVGPNSEYTAVDVSTIPDAKDSGLFPVAGIHFVYKRTGSVNVKQDQIKHIESVVDKAGRTLTRPDDETLLKTGQKISQVLGQSYGEFYTKQGKEEPFVWRKEVVSDKKRKECRMYIKKLHSAFKNPSYANRYGFVTADDRINAKDIVHWCKFNMKFAPGALGVGNELDELFTRGDAQGNPYGMRGYQPSNANPVFGEGIKTLDNVIKENLLRVKKIKDDKILTESQIILESKIIKQRFNVISENKLIITKRQKKKFFNEVINEMFYLNQNGYNKNLINEGLWEFLKGAFGDSADVIMQVFKEHIAEWFIEKITPMDPDGWMANLITTSVGNLEWSEISKLTDCGNFTKFMSKNIVETIIKKMGNKSGAEGTFFDFMRNTIIEALEKSELGQKIETGLSNFVCPSLSNVKSKMSVLTDKMKTGALNAASK